MRCPPAPVQRTVGTVLSFQCSLNGEYCTPPKHWHFPIAGAVQ